MPLNKPPILQLAPFALFRRSGRRHISSLKVLALTVGLSALPIAGAASEDSRPGQPPEAVQSTPNGLSRRNDFSNGLDRYLNSLLERDLISSGAAKDIRGEFRSFLTRFPRLYEQPGFEHAIPAARPLRQPYSSDIEGIRPRRLPDILGSRTIRSEDVGEIFRRMFAPKMEDGIYFDMFVREFYAAMTDRGGFRTADGNLDERAISASLQRSRDGFAIWSRKLEEMKRDGSFGRFVDALNHMAAFTEARGISFQPLQARSGIAELASCISAKGDTPPEAYINSCAALMLWMGDHRSNATGIVFYGPRSGDPGAEQAFAPWDAKYAKEAYGPVFSDIQATANDRFWRRYFKPYIATAQAVEAELSAMEMGAVLTLERMVGRTAKLLNAYLEKRRFEGNAVSAADVQASLDDAKRKKAECESRTSQTMKAQLEYRETMKGIDQVAARAAMVGIK